jgi:hypothetical protein
MKKFLLLFVAFSIATTSFSQDRKYRLGLSGGAMDIGGPSIKSTFGYEAHVVTEVNFTDKCGLRVLPGIVQHGGRYSFPELGIKETTIVNDYANLQVLAKYRVVHSDEDPDIILLAGVFGDYSIVDTVIKKKVESGYTVQGFVAWKHVEVGVQYSNTLLTGSDFKRSWENVGFKLNFIW